jgi:hypothetical protein
MELEAGDVTVTEVLPDAAVTVIAISPRDIFVYSK